MTFVSFVQKQQIISIIMSAPVCIKGKYNYNFLYFGGWAMLMSLQPAGTLVTSSRICLPVFPTRHRTHLQ